MPKPVSISSALQPGQQVRVSGKHATNTPFKVVSAVSRWVRVQAMWPVRGPDGSILLEEGGQFNVERGDVSLWEPVPVVESAVALVAEQPPVPPEAPAAPVKRTPKLVCWYCLENHRTEDCKLVPAALASGNVFGSFMEKFRGKGEGSDG